MVSSLAAALHAPVSGLVIATPAETHYELVKQAFEAGKDVFVEKPLALTCAQGAHPIRLAETYERILMVGHVLEYHPAILRLYALIQQGILGKVQYIYSNRVSLGKVRREENILWSFAPHDVAVILRLMGSLPCQVAAYGGSYVQPNIADVTVTHLLFENGVRAHIHVSWLHPFKEQRLVVIGSRQMASFDDVAKRLVLYDQRVELKEGEPAPSRGTVRRWPLPVMSRCGSNVRPSWRRCARVAPLTDGTSGLRVLKVLQAAQRSLVMNGESVQLPLEMFAPNGLQAML